MRSLLFVPLFAACATQPADTDVVGPFTGPRTRFVVDSFKLPTNNTESRELGDDLNGDRSVDNQLGMVIGALASEGNVTTGTASMIASGVLASSVEIQADDLTTDPSVAVTYFGADGAPAKAVGGAIVDGRFVSNLTRTTHISAEAELHLAVLDAADPVVLHARAIEITLTPDGRGGYDGLFRGVCDPSETNDAAAKGIIAMLDAKPRDHVAFAALVDSNADGTITIAEVEHNDFISALLAPDLKMFDGDELAPDSTSTDEADSLSIGFGFHLAPCPSGSCITAPPADRCNDRVIDGDETDVDCGGSCGTCGAGAACAIASDCESGACDAGRCRAPSCSDGRLDGFEVDLDCGRACATKCADQQLCLGDADCESGVCGKDGRCL
jgi:hypothetical protein